MWFDGYHRQFGKRLEEFQAVAIPAMLADLSPGQEEQVPQGAKEFPFDAVLDVLNSKHSYEDMRLPSSSGHPICADLVSVGEDVHCESTAQEIHAGVPA